MPKTRFLISLLFTMIGCISVLAQDACPALVQSALDYIDTQCSGIERNQACYGNLQIQAVPQPGVTDFKFDAPGDIENIVDIQSLNLSPMTTPDEWGVSLMSVQANLPDSTPGQNVTMLLFGDVKLENQGGAAKIILLDVTAKNNARVRSGPGTQNGQIGSLKGGDAVKADGRNEAGDWIRVQLPDSTAGWVSADLMTITGDKMTLAVVEGTEIAGTSYGPMQAFYFTSGIGNPGCADAPPDGMLIQTPEGAGKVDFLINEVQIEIGSTVYLYAQPSSILHAAVLEGGISITSQGVTLNVPAGAVGVVPLDENALPVGAPTLQGYSDNQAAALAPLMAALPEQIEIAPGLTEADLAVAPTSGQWLITITDLVLVGNQCTITANVGDSFVTQVTFDDAGMHLGNGVLPLTGTNTYSGVVDGETYTGVFTSPSAGIISTTGGCINTTTSLTYQGN